MSPTEQPASPSTAVAEAFIDAMGQLASGVVLVTCRVDGRPWGLTVSACCSVSAAPPLLLISLGAGTTSARTITDTGRFGVSILGESVLDVARFGSAKGQSKFVHEFCHSDQDSAGVSQTPIVARAIAHIDCTVAQAVEAADHVIYIGAVESAIVGSEDNPVSAARSPGSSGDSPLIYYNRRYHRLGDTTDRGTRLVLDEVMDCLLYDYPVPVRFGTPPDLGAGRDSHSSAQAAPDAKA